jgi:glyoxylase-like metal-dependent hydrolase (beta-lactamase superfamily II)
MDWPSWLRLHTTPGYGEARSQSCGPAAPRTDLKGAILVDTGLHPSIATDPKENFGALAARSGKPTLEPGEAVPAQLRKRGLEPGEIPIVVMTHMHLDHTSAISEFPRSTFVLSEAEWQEAAHGRSPLLNGYRRAHFDYAFEYRTVSFDRANIDSYASFGRTFDLFGDGSIRLAYTPGHSPGHMSVIAHLAENDFIIGGDAMYVAGQLDGSEPLPPRPADAHNLRRSLQELRLFRSQFPSAVITPGRDPEFYGGVEKIYRQKGRGTRAPRPCSKSSWVRGLCAFESPCG